MKHLLFINILMLLFITNAYSELTQSDLDKIRLIVKDEVNQAIKESEKRMRHYVDAKIETVNAKIQALDDKFTSQIQGLDHKFTSQIKGVDDKFTSQIQGLQSQINILFWVIIALIPVSIALPQLLIWHQSRKNGTKK